MPHFETRFLDEADAFLAGLPIKAARKVLYHIDVAEKTNDPRFFKKLQQDIWEFRTRFATRQIRLLAFWDRRNAGETLVIATHGFIKKTDKVPLNEIKRALQLKDNYFNK